jgi:hypothetical protein
MGDNKLLEETVLIVRKIFAQPTAYLATTYDAEICITTLLAIAVALERGDPLEQSLRRVWDEVRELTKNVPANPEDARYLCEVQIVPERKASNHMLLQRGVELCARLLESWPPGEFKPLKKGPGPDTGRVQYRVRDSREE